MSDQRGQLLTAALGFAALVSTLSGCTRSEYPWIQWVRSGHAKSGQDRITYDPGVYLKTPFGSRTECYHDLPGYRTWWQDAVLGKKSPEVNLAVPGNYIQYLPALPNRSTVYLVSTDGSLRTRDYECWPLGERPMWAEASAR